MRPETGLVCQSLIVVSNCMPGSPQAQAASEISRSSAFALIVSTGVASTRAVSAQSSPSSAFFMNSSVARTELLAFWNWIDCQASPFRLMSYPASPSAQAFCSSFALHHTNSRTSGWSASRTTIFAARRVVPPDLIEPATLSAPRMNDTGPEA
jgi:hypothetical protein